VLGRAIRPFLAFAVFVTAVVSLNADLAASRSAPDARTRRVTELVNRHLVSGGPGLAVAVVQGSRVVHVSAHGLASGPAGGEVAPVTPATRFDTASIAKQFTAASVLQLVERGRVRLDAPVSQYLPELAAKRPVRVRDLLWMTSGLADFHWTGRDFAPTKPARVTNDDVVRFVAREPALAKPGERHEYSNADYVLLAAIVERVTGQPYPEYLRTHILEPAGMSATAQVDARHPAPPAAAGHERRGHRWVELASPLGVSGASHLYSTVEDMARWAIALERGQVVRDPALRELAVTAHERTRYAFGWNIKRHLGSRLAWHTGRWPGYRSYIGRYLDNGLTVVVLSNDHGMSCGVLGGRIAELFAPPAAAD
jgi:D-alanyl-D-alanine carboxypeptidase